MNTYNNAIDVLREKENGIKKSIISDIKSYMKEHQMSEFVCFFFDEEKRVSEENKKEYNKLVDKNGEDMWNADFEYNTEYTNYALPFKIWIDDNNKLNMHCALIWCGDGGVCGDEEKDFNEDEFIGYYCPENLNRMLKNIQNEDFYRMREIIGE